MEIQITEDGFHTLFNAELNETYHSKFGAYEESKYVFLEQGLIAFLNKQEKTISNPIHVFELGFGTGLNALLFADFAIQQKIEIHYTGIEISPVPFEIIEQLNYTSLFKTDAKELFLDISKANWNECIAIHPYFNLRKIHGDIHTHALNEFKNNFDVILMDAFAPDKQASIWELEIFQKLFEIQKSEGILVTYSAKGAVKRGMKEAGFLVEKLPGPPMKRHMLRAFKPLQNEAV
jgi:tRNA U34 5-methylaminomethyl-2-thiouridine-forming methyltransferase MnmC